MGNFFNVFDVDTDVTMDPRVGLKACGRKRVNMYKTGVPLHSFSKWATRIVEIGHTVGLVVQLDNGKGQMQQRQLVKVQQRGQIEHDSTCISLAGCKQPTAHGTVQHPRVPQRVPRATIVESNQ